MFNPFVEEQVHPITWTLENNGQVFSTFSLKQLLSNSAMFLPLRFLYLWQLLSVDYKGPTHLVSLCPQTEYNIVVVFEAFLVFKAPWMRAGSLRLQGAEKPWMHEEAALGVVWRSSHVIKMSVFFFNRRIPYVMKDFLHSESCLEKYYACWQGSLISMVYFDKLTYFLGDNLVFVLHFSVIGNFHKCISHHTLTKFSSFKQKCEHQCITVFSGRFFSFFHVKFARFQK
jgi:hypothetical protein